MACTGNAWHSQIMLLKIDPDLHSRDQMLRAFQYALQMGADVITTSIAARYVLEAYIDPDCKKELPVSDKDMAKQMDAKLFSEWSEYVHGGKTLGHHALITVSQINCGGIPFADERHETHGFTYPTGMSGEHNDFQSAPHLADGDVIGVTSVQSTGANPGWISDFAAGGWLDTQIGAPGEFFPSLDASSPTAFVPADCAGAAQDCLSGTSFATPMVAGAALLCLAANLPAYRAHASLYTDETGVQNLRQDVLYHAQCSTTGMCDCSSNNVECTDSAGFPGGRNGIQDGRVLDTGAAVTAATVRPAR